MRILKQKITMILGFKTMFKGGKKTFFEEKIKKGIIEYDLKANFKVLWLQSTLIMNQKPKIHTIRKDTTNRWKEGRPIQFATGVRTPYYSCFAQAKCLSVQNFVFCSLGSLDTTFIHIDGNLISDKTIQDLAENDGFDNIEDFISYFMDDSKDTIGIGVHRFYGKIIHWTDKKY